MDKPSTWDRALARGTIDAVVSGNVVKDVAAPSVLVTAQADLSGLAGYPPGTIAYTAGFKNMWQLAANGSWVSLR